MRPARIGRRSASTVAAVNFAGPLSRHPLHGIRRLVLRQMYGDAIANDDSYITIAKEYPAESVVSPETAVPSSQSQNILADTVDGTILYDPDANTRTIIKDFSAQGALVGKQVRIAARYRQDGTLTAYMLIYFTEDLPAD